MPEGSGPSRAPASHSAAPSPRALPGAPRRPSRPQAAHRSRTASGALARVAEQSLDLTGELLLVEVVRTDARRLELAAREGEGDRGAHTDAVDVADRPVPVPADGDGPAAVLHDGLDLFVVAAHR